jgi:hypothetical protein
VAKPGGSVLISEYGTTPHRHWLYRFGPSRWALGYWEPFLPTFWQENVTKKLQVALQKRGKSLANQPTIEYCFAKFYRVLRFDVSK